MRPDSSQSKAPGLPLSTPCPYFCRDGHLLVWTVNLPEPSTQPCPACTPQPLRQNGKTALTTLAITGIDINSPP